MNFREWLFNKNEVSTSTANVAGFACPMMGVVRRDWTKPRTLTFKGWEKEDGDIQQTVRSKRSKK